MQIHTFIQYTYVYPYRVQQHFNLHTSIHITNSKKNIVIKKMSFNLMDKSKHCKGRFIPYATQYTIDIRSLNYHSQK